MAGYTDVIKKNTRPYLESLADDIKARRDPDFFWPTGTQVYCGKQGSGKTISAVKHIIDLKKRYPKSVIVSNIDLKILRGIKCSTEENVNMFLNAPNRQKLYIQFSSMQELALLLVAVNNERLGVIYVIDEIHTYFNALESKNIPMFVFTEISQQRKQRKLIIGTSQLFLRMAKPFREQCDNVIICKTLFGIITIQRAYDGMTLDQDYNGKLVGTVKKTGWFFHNRKIRTAFDTFQKVVSGQEQYETNAPMEFTKNTRKMFAGKR